LPVSRRQRSGSTEGYEAQLSYEDEVLGRFWSFLATRGFLQKSLVVFTSDHGEGLGDHGESTHGYFVYQSTLRVPLIIRWPAGSGTFLSRVDEPASLLDVAPTILQFIRIVPPSGFQGRSLLAEASRKGMAGQAEIYGESLFARNHFGCSAISSLRQGALKYIEAPKPELYDLATDPEEAHNIYAREKSLGLSLRERLNTLKSHFREHRSMPRALNTEGEAALRSLGYLSGSSPMSNTPESGADPKDRIVEAETFHLAVALASSGKLEESNRLLERLRAKFPEVMAIPMTLGLNQQKLGKHAEAMDNFRAALKGDPANAEAYSSLAASSLALRREDEAIRELQAALAIDPSHSRAYRLLGAVWMQRKNYAQAWECFSHMLAIAPEDYEAHYQLAILATFKGRWKEGEQHLLAALKTDPDSPEAYNALGSIYFRQGNLNEARDTFIKALRLKPNFAWAHYNLGLVLRQQNHNEEAARQFRQALAADPQFQLARQALDVLDHPQR
jgi:tetratricopeptide (TPR) repeat protein